MNPSICIVDYGVGNIQSIRNALSILGYNCNISGSAVQIAKADFLILPGVGAFDEAMKNLKFRHLDEVLTTAVI